MKNTIAAAQTLGIALCGQRVTEVEVHNSHGEVLELVFENGTRLHVCSTHGICDKSVKDDPNDIYVSLNERAL
jgi:hypothetical protein